MHKCRNKVYLINILPVSKVAANVLCTQGAEIIHL